MGINRSGHYKWKARQGQLNVSILLFYDSFQKGKTNCRCRSGGFNLQIVFCGSIEKDFSGSREFFVRQPQIELYRNVGQKGKQKGQIRFFLQFCSTQLRSGFPDCLRVMQTNPADNTVIIPVKACTLCQAAGAKFAQGKEFPHERSAFRICQILQNCQVVPHLQCRRNLTFRPTDPNRDSQGFRVKCPSIPAQSGQYGKLNRVCAFQFLSGGRAHQFKLSIILHLAKTPVGLPE